MELLPVDIQILAVAEDRLTGFHPHPFDAIAERSGVPVAVVLERLRALLASGQVRRIRQTLLSTGIAEGALVAWQVPQQKLENAWEWLRQHDPFTGHVVIRRCDKGYGLRAPARGRYVCLRCRPCTARPPATRRQITRAAAHATPCAPTAFCTRLAGAHAA